MLSEQLRCTDETCLLKAQIQLSEVYQQREHHQYERLTALSTVAEYDGGKTTNLKELRIRIFLKHPKGKNHN